MAPLNAAYFLLILLSGIVLGYPGATLVNRGKTSLTAAVTAAAGSALSAASSSAASSSAASCLTAVSSADAAPSEAVSSADAAPSEAVSSADAAPSEAVSSALPSSAPASSTAASSGTASSGAFSSGAYSSSAASSRTSSSGAVSSGAASSAAVSSEAATSNAIATSTKATAPRSQAASSSSSSEVPSSIASGGVTKQGCVWVVANAGRFTHMATYSFNGNSLPSGLQANENFVDDMTDGAPYNHQFLTSNVAVSGGYVNLLVPGGQNPQSNNNVIDCAEIQTVETDIIYASVRTNAIFSTVPGTCHGNFFYQSDHQETDIEYLTDPNSLSNPGNGAPPDLQYTDQATKVGGQATYSPGPAPADVAVLHEYRTDWVPGKVSFYLDGVLQQTFTSNVPSKAGQWVWNNWANGDANFTVGPPQQDNVFKIQGITMYYNTTAKVGTC